MRRCNCGSNDYDVDWGCCYDCFCASRSTLAESCPEPTDAELCAGHGHPEYVEGSGVCLCKGDQDSQPPVKTVGEE